MIQALQKALNDILLGKENIIHLAISCLLAEGHLLLEDLPGMGKTTLSHALAHLTGMQYRRIQFTSDLLPSDLLGVSIFDTTKQNFTFHQGPIFSQLVLADEINRASPKTQSALLEAMEEKQVTTDTTTHPLPTPFFVIATQNPTFQTGTYALPESQLDRFLMCLAIGYPNKVSERKLLLADPKRTQLDATQAILTPQQLLTLQQQSMNTHLSEIMLDYIQSLLHASRNHGWFSHGLSPRAGRAIVRAAQAYAMVDQRDFIRAEDIQAIFPHVVNHRLVVLESKSHQSASDILLNHVEVPI